MQKRQKRGINPSTIERSPLMHSQTNFITLLNKSNCWKASVTVGNYVSVIKFIYCPLRE